MSSAEFDTVLVGMHSNMLLAAAAFVKNKDDAYDLTQETMFKAINNKDLLRNHSNLKGWVFTIMKNIFLNGCKSASYKHTLNETIDSTKKTDSFNNVNTAEYSLSLSEIMNEVDRLDTSLKHVLKMHIDGFKYEEIACEIGIPIGTVKSRIHSARKKLSLNLYQLNR